MAKGKRLKRVLLSLLVVLVLVAASIGGITYSWTYTPHGRLDYTAAIISKLASWSTEPLEISPQAREASREMDSMVSSSDALAEGVRSEDRMIPRPDGSLLPIRIYWPESPEPLPLYLDIHGGGWWMGDGYPLHVANSHFAKRAGVILVSVEYRLVPEYVFPAQLDDSSTALAWMQANAATIGGDPDRLAVGGGSAGGNLAAALAIRTRDEGGPKISFQFLFVPATDICGSRHWPSFDEMGDDYMLKVSGVHDMIAAYVPDPAMRTLPTASPLLAADHAGLPPALVVTAQFDPLRDQGEAYAHALKAAGVPVTLHRENGSIHGFVGSPDRMNRIYDMGADAVHKALLIEEDAP